MIDLNSLLSVDRVSVHCQVQSKKRALQTLAELLAQHTDPDTLSDMDILDALIARERLGSTGLGHGVALPHSRVPILKAPMAALITLEQGVDFGALDDQPVDIVMGLLVPENCNDEHLKILAALAGRFGDVALRDALRVADNSDLLLARMTGEP